jgi:hypothetical protein
VVQKPSEENLLCGLGVCFLLKNENILEESNNGTVVKADSGIRRGISALKKECSHNT